MCRQRRHLLGGGRENRRRIRRIVAHDTVRFLPSQEWSTCGRGIVGVFWALLSAAVAIYIYAAVGGTQL